MTRAHALFRHKIPPGSDICQTRSCRRSLDSDSTPLQQSVVVVELFRDRDKKLICRRGVTDKKKKKKRRNVVHTWRPRCGSCTAGLKLLLQIYRLVLRTLAEPRKRFVRFLGKVCYSRPERYRDRDGKIYGAIAHRYIRTCGKDSIARAILHEIRPLY